MTSNSWLSQRQGLKWKPKHNWLNNWKISLEYTELKFEREKNV